MKAVILLALLGCTQSLAPGNDLSRRRVLNLVPATAAGVLASPLAAGATTKGDAEKVLATLQPLDGYVDEGKWDSVRSVLKASPVAELWNLGASKNWIRTAALEAGDPELIELSEDLSSALQLTDQYVYDNNFIYYQPGNGKLKIKEPKDQIRIARKKLEAIIASL